MNFTIKKFSIKTSTKGFTLVEMLVASGIFAGIVVMAIGALFQAQRLNTRVQQTQIILDGANLSMETIVRDIRYGYYYHCADGFSTTTIQAQEFHRRRSCPLDLTMLNVNSFVGKALIFHPVNMVNDTDRVAYYIEERNGNSRIMKATCEGTDPGDVSKCLWNQSSEQITGDDTYIESLSFFVTGANSSVATDGTNYQGAGAPTGDDIQPIITILVSGRTKPGDGTATVPFHLQFSTVARALDN
ncbi:MAG: Prepilin-type N-terminal cleavage/methylation protein [Patescibacteria group bacterium]|nr:Prepilin-type N-terminal cleavage/methylation protein [Patescibacteria group bacterium]